MNENVERDRFGSFKKWNLPPLAERFWIRVDKTGDCWPWLGAVNKEGYGSLKISGRMYRAPRISYNLVKGIIPDGMIVMHTCDNPRCVNPKHLIVGTHKDNTQDMLAKGRGGVINYREAQMKGAIAKKHKTESVTLPSVILGLRQLMAEGVNPTQHNCRLIPGYNSIQRYVKQTKLIAMARGEAECVLFR